jgi:lipopolysaccharide export system protein LptC
MLVVLPLMATVFVFMVIRWVYHDWEASLTIPVMESAGRPDMLEGKAGMPLAPSLVHTVTNNLDLKRYDHEGRLESRFLADSLTHETEKTCDIVRPQLQYFTQNGEIITVLADNGRLLTDGALTDLDHIQSGVMWGHVIMIHDNGTPDDHSDDILIDMDDIKFNNEASELSTDGPVLMVGLEMQLTASKMRITLDPKTRKPTTIQFLENIRITLESGDKMERLMPAGGASSAPVPAAKTPKAAPPKPAVPPAAAPGKTKSAPGKTPSSPPPDLWRIDILGNIEARKQDQGLTGERLTLFNRAAKTTPGSGAGADQKKSGSGKAAAGTRTVTEPPVAPEGREGAAEAAARFLKPGGPPPMIISATGPLIITPVTAAERPTMAAEFKIAEADVPNFVLATGSRVVVENGPTRIVGDEVRFNTQTNSGSVIGKETPFQLDDPARMLHLTGMILNFNNSVSEAHPYPTAEVQGEGRLMAQTTGGSLSVSGRSKPPVAGQPAAQAPVKPPETLDATWTHDMQLEFYSVPANLMGKGSDAGATPATTTTSTGAGSSGEIRSAVFHGQAVVKQGDAIMKGNTLATDFFAPEKGKGQAIQRLQGEVNVYMHNEPRPEKKDAVPAASPAPATSTADPKSLASAFGDITCQKIDMQFERNAAGDSQIKTLDASGDVVINDAGGLIKGKTIKARFGPAAKGSGVDLVFFEGRGNVWIDREDIHAEGDHVLRDLSTGLLFLEGAGGKWAVARQGDNEVQGAWVQFSETEGWANVNGAGLMKMPSKIDLRGNPTTPAPATPTGTATTTTTAGTAKTAAKSAVKPPIMTIVWQKRMAYEGTKNIALFEGAVSATTDTSRVDSQQLWVYTADKPPATQAAPGAAASVAAPATAKAAPKDKTNPLAGDKTPFLGRDKEIVRIYAETDVRVLERRFDVDLGLRSQMEIASSNLTFITATKKAIIHGPGEVRLLAREKPQAGEAPAPGLTAEGAVAAVKGSVPDGYSRTYVKWKDSMAYVVEDTGNRAYFTGDVNALFTGRGAPGDKTSRGKVTTNQVQSDELRIDFSAKKPAEPGAPPPPPPDPNQSPEERMAVEKFLAKGNVRLLVGDRSGTCYQVSYQHEPEMMRMYGGPGPKDWARLWHEDEAKQKYGEVVAGTITFYPSTNKIEAENIQNMTESSDTKAPAVPGKKKSTNPLK